MQYITEDDLKNEIEGWNELKTKSRVIMIANTWLKAKGLPEFDIVPDEIKWAGVEIAQAYIDGKLYQSRDGVVKSKTVKAGDVSTSKTYADGLENAMCEQELVALDLIKSYIEPKFTGAVKTIRGL